MSAAGPRSDSASLALLNQGSGSIGAELRSALEALGAHIAYESALPELDRAALKASGARVVVINLAPGGDEVDDLIDWLDAEQCEIVINDSETSARLEGADLARFARHLAAKILHRPDIILPPRPPGAVAPPTFQQHWADRVPEADVPGAPAPARLAVVAAPVAIAKAEPVPEPVVVPPPAMPAAEIAEIAHDDAASGDPDSIDAQLEQALRSLEASAKTHVPTEEVPDLDVLLASSGESPEAAKPAELSAPPPVRATGEPAQALPPVPSFSQWSLEPVIEPEPERAKGDEFGIETLTKRDSLAPEVFPNKSGSEPDKYFQAASSVKAVEKIPPEVFLSPEVEPEADKPTPVKFPVLSALELMPLDDEIVEDPKNPKK